MDQIDNEWMGRGSGPSALTPVLSGRLGTVASAIHWNDVGINVLPTINEADRVIDLYEGGGVELSAHGADRPPLPSNLGPEACGCPIPGRHASPSVGNGVTYPLLAGYPFVLSTTGFARRSYSTTVKTTFGKAHHRTEEAMEAAIPPASTEPSSPCPQ